MTLARPRALRRARWATLIAALAVVSLAVPAAAQTPREENWERCEARTPQRRIEGCSAVIRAGGEPDAGLAIAYYNRAMAYSDIGQPIQAIADFDRVIQLDPSNAQAFNNRGIAWFSRGQHDRAIEDYTEAIRQKPDFADAFNNRGLAWFTKGDLGRAIRDYDLAIRLSLGIFALAHDNRALAHLKAGRNEAAIADYEASLGEDLLNPVALYGRGLARLRRGEAVLGESDIAIAKQLREDIALEFEKYGVR